MSKEEASHLEMSMDLKMWMDAEWCGLDWGWLGLGPRDQSSWHANHSSVSISQTAHKSHRAGKSRDVYPICKRPAVPVCVLSMIQKELQPARKGLLKVFHSAGRNYCLSVRQPRGRSWVPAFASKTRTSSPDNHAGSWKELCDSGDAFVDVCEKDELRKRYLRET